MRLSVIVIFSPSVAIERPVPALASFTAKTTAPLLLIPLIEATTSVELALTETASYTAPPVTTEVLPVSTEPGVIAIEAIPLV